MEVDQDGAFRRRHFTVEVILWALRWYPAFPISYRDGTVKLRGLQLGGAGAVRYPSRMTARRDPLYAGYRYPAEPISYAVWRYFRFPLNLRMVEEMLAARGLSVTCETIRQRGLKFGQSFANRIRRRAPCRGDKTACLLWRGEVVRLTVCTFEGCTG